MAKRYISETEYKGLVAEICRTIANTDWKPDYIVGITRGGLLPAVMISHYFNVPMHTLKVALRDNADCESNLWMSEDAFGYVQKELQGSLPYSIDASRNILIVDDINDSGETINWIMKDWQSSCLPDHDRWTSVWNQNVKFAVVYDNLLSKSQVKMDFVGQELVKQDDDWLVFPYEAWWR